MKLTKIVAIVALLFCYGLSYSQTGGSAKGKVISDSTGKPLPAASIKVVGTKRGTTTDTQGNFTIKLPESGKSYTLQVIYTGYATKEISVKDGDNITIKLKDDIKDEGEVVVQTGYGAGIKKKELAASVSTVGAKDLKDIPINNVAEALNGRLAGVTATTAEGSPDAEVRVRVRGGVSITQDNTPLYVIDGVIVENGLSNVVLQEIQDITVLKDAAATALYGARGANGVIVITTKTGKVGKPRVSYNAYYGFKNLTKKLDVLTPNEFIFYQYERYAQANTLSDFYARYVSTWDSVTHFQEYKQITPINWQQEVMGNRGYTQQHNINVTGGSKVFTYTGSYTYQDDKAIVLNSSFKKHQGNAKFEIKPTSKLTIGLSGRFTNQNVYGAGVSDDKASFNRLRQAVKYRPYLLPGETEDNIDDEESPGNSLILINPVRMVKQEFKRKTTNSINATASLTYKFNKNLTFKSTFGLDRNLVESRMFYDSATAFSIVQNGKNPIIQFDSLQKKSWVNSNTISYVIRNYKKRHDFDFLLGQEWRQLKTFAVHHEARNLQRFMPKDSLFDNFNSLTPYGVAIPNEYDESGASFFTRIGYTYNKKYILNVVVRADGSSKFTKEKRWGVFPSASFAWRASQEKFFDKVKFISDLKIRGGFGANGNSRIGDYLFRSVFNPNDYLYGLNGTPVYAWSLASIANQNVTWESVINRNIGFDITLLKKRLDFSFDYYYNTTKNLLLDAKIAPTYGFDKQIQNIGKTKSSGVEMQLNAIIVQKPKGLNWNANFNISFNKVQVEALTTGSNTYVTDNSWFNINSSPDYLVKIGEQLGSVYGFVTDGFYKVEDFDYNTTTQKYTLKTGVVKNNVVTPQPGTIKFKDLDGNGYVSATGDSDRTIIGHTAPKFTGGLNQQFTYKNWDASLFLNFSFGNDVYNANNIELTNGYTNNSNMFSIMRDRWKTVNAAGVLVTDPTELAAMNANAKIWQPMNGSGEAAFVTHSWAVEDGSFLRINNLTIGYSIPLKTLVKWGISKFRIYITGNNLAVFTKYSGYDPEVSVKNNGLTPGLDYSAYPKSRSIIFGLNVGF